MDAKEQELIEARDEARRKWDEASLKSAAAHHKRAEATRKRDEAYLKCAETRREWAEADSKLWKYQKSNAQ